MAGVVQSTSTHGAGDVCMADIVLICMIGKKVHTALLPVKGHYRFLGSCHASRVSACENGQD